jgi:hypothetical protein
MFDTFLKARAACPPLVILQRSKKGGGRSDAATVKSHES